MKKIVIIALMIICNVTTFQAQQFVYKPTNPAFGGDTFNYNWLLSSAAAQNQFKDTGATSSSTSTLDSFTDSINKSLRQRWLCSKSIISSIHIKSNSP